MVKKNLYSIVIILLVLLSSSLVLASDVHVVNSEDWVEVYSVMLHAGLNHERGFFLNSESIADLTKVISKDDTIKLYQSEISPFIPYLEKQLASLDYDVENQYVKLNMNFDLDPKTGYYFLVSLDNPRITSSLAPLAIKENAWVFVVDKENVDLITERLAGASEVVAVGKFPRDVLSKIDPYLTEHIVNDDIYKDSEDLASKFKRTDNYVITDGAFIESEFFQTTNPVLLSGANKILGQTFDYLKSRDAKAVILVGNELSVVGEQIRSQSNKKMSVFVKFGQGDTANSGQVYALSVFPLPAQRLGLTAQQAIYDPINKELIITFKNIGNTAVYELTNLRIMTGDTELASTADEDIVFISAGELLPVSFPLDLDLGSVKDDTLVEFYTSFGLGPNELDTFLTMTNRYGPPFALPLTVQEIDDDSSTLYVEDVAYYRNLNRVGVTLTNPGDLEVFFTAKVHDLIINGLKETVTKEGSIKPGETKKVYFNAKLDLVDLDDNQLFDVVFNYGKQADFQFKTIAVEQPFKVVSGSRITGFVTGLGEGSAGSWVAVLAVILVLGVIVRLLKNRESKEEAPKVKPKKIASKTKLAKPKKVASKAKVIKSKKKN